MLRSLAAKQCLSKVGSLSKICDNCIDPKAPDQSVQLYVNRSKNQQQCNIARKLCHLIFTACFSFTLALSKTWIQNNDWETMRNWNPQRLPCASDIVNIDVVIMCLLTTTSDLDQIFLEQITNTDLAEKWTEYLLCKNMTEYELVFTHFHEKEIV